MSTQTRDLIGWLGFAVALAAYRAPFREVWGSYGIINVRSTAHLATGLPFIAGLVNNSLWLSYYAARPLDFIPSLCINTCGIVLHASYTAVYLYYAPPSEIALFRRYMAVGACAVCAAAACYAQYGMASGRSTVGAIAAICNIVVFYSPLAAAGEVVRTRSVARMPFQPLIFGFLSAFVWGTYGWYIRDIPIIIPNAIGIVLCTIQLVLYAYYAQVKEEPAGVASSVAGNAVKIAGRGSNGRYSVVPKSLGLGDLSPRISRARLRSPHSPAREQRSMTPESPLRSPAAREQV